jgi:adenine-specific DNA methylase
MRLVPLKEDGTPDIDALNAEFGEDYLKVEANPRWIAKPTAAYLWARAVTCKNCRAAIPLLKTKWLCKNARRRVLLTMEPSTEKTGIVFGIEANVLVKGGNTCQRLEHDKRIGVGTMSRAGSKCPCCGTIMTMEDIRAAGKAGHLSMMPTAVVVITPDGKDYRLPTVDELQYAGEAANEIEQIFADLPFGPPDEPTPSGGGKWCRPRIFSSRIWVDALGRPLHASPACCPRSLREG